MAVAATTARDQPLEVLSFALAGLAGPAHGCAGLDAAVRNRCDRERTRVGARGQSLLAALKAVLKEPAERDYALVEVARQFGLTLVELLGLRLTMAAEEDLEIAHAIAHLQAPAGGHRPTVALLAHAFGEALGMSALQVIGHGAAVRHGLLRLDADNRPMPERQISVPLPTCLALQGIFSPWPGTRLLELPASIALGSAVDAHLARLAADLGASTTGDLLVLRSGEPLETRAAAAQLAALMKAPAVIVDGEDWQGIAPWLFVHGALPVFALQLAPGERRPPPRISGHAGPTVVLCGIDGEMEDDGRHITDWRIPIPDRPQRLELWSAHVPEPLARQLAAEHRHSASRIATLARDARAQAGNAPIAADHVRAAARRSSVGLSALAELVTDEISDDALVASPSMRRDLEDLVQRCRLRDGLVDGFGPALRARYRPSVRVLLVGPSGTGKTLAASWIAGRLGLPLYRVDLSAVTSKYIGDTEKNLSQLLGRAEQNEVVLLFDEADALFGKRTEVRDAHDRFANAQTNFLLQRLENYDGIVLLTSNSRARFDAAFSRRLDLVLELPPPGPEERRALWLAHLGEGHALTPAQVNRLAAAAELSGGQIRTALITAAIHAARHGGVLGFDDILSGLAVEFRKLGRQPPALAEARAT